MSHTSRHRTRSVCSQLGQFACASCLLDSRVFPDSGKLVLQATLLLCSSTSYSPWAARQYAPADGSSRRIYVRPRTGPHMAKLQAASVPLA